MSTITQYKRATILGIPSEKYPNMVQIIKTPKKLNTLIGKKYITITKCITTIDMIDTSRLIAKSEANVKKELAAWVVTED